MRTVTKDQLVKIVAAAMAAQNQANKLRDKTGRVTPAKFPGTTLINFQKLDGTLTADNFYGPNTVAALTWYLQKSKNPAVPKAAAKYDHIVVSWEAPSLYEPSKPATAAAVPTPAPKAQESRPLIASKPAPAPAPAPAPSSKSSSGLVPDFSNLKSQIQRQVSSAKKVPKKRKIPATPAHGQELHTIKPKHDAEEHIAAKASGHKITKPKSHDAEDLIAAKVAKSQGPALQKMQRMLIKKALQEQATSEHKNLNKEQAFKKTVLSQLASIKSRMSSGGLASKTSGERRIVGLVL